MPDNNHLDIAVAKMKPISRLELALCPFLDTFLRASAYDQQNGQEENLVLIFCIAVKFLLRYLVHRENIV